jgi:hypothetical protein
MKTIVFLEGTKVLDHKNFVSDNTEGYTKVDFNSIVLDNLYEDFGKLICIKFIKPEYIHIRTTGLMHEKINVLVDLFESLNYIPKNIIFGNERSAMILLGLARELKAKGTKFWFMFDELEEISWI